MKTIKALILCSIVLLTVRPASAVYNPATGKWLSRDPVGEPGFIGRSAKVQDNANPVPSGRWINRNSIGSKNEPNKYGFAKNQPTAVYDCFGLWGSDVHSDWTRQWASESGVSASHAVTIGASDNEIDNIYSPYDKINWPWHFNRSRSGNDTRLQLSDSEIRLAKWACSKLQDNAHYAATHLGYALHPLQDWVAHGDFNRAIDAPNVDGMIVLYAHNLFGPDGPYAVDKPNMDSDGPDGRPTIDVMWPAFDPGSMGDVVFGASFHSGNARLKLTETKTKGVLNDFRSFVKANSKPCGICYRAFVDSNAY